MLYPIISFTGGPQRGPEFLLEGAVAVLGFAFLGGEAVGGHNFSWGHGPILLQ